MNPKTGPLVVLLLACSMSLSHGSIFSALKEWWERKTTVVTPQERKEIRETFEKTAEAQQAGMSGATPLTPGQPPETKQEPSADLKAQLYDLTKKLKEAKESELLSILEKQWKKITEEMKAAGPSKTEEFRTRLTNMLKAVETLAQPSPQEKQAQKIQETPKEEKQPKKEPEAQPEQKQPEIEKPELKKPHKEPEQPKISPEEQPAAPEEQSISPEEFLKKLSPKQLLGPQIKNQPQDKELEELMAKQKQLEQEELKIKAQIEFDPDHPEKLDEQILQKLDVNDAAQKEVKQKIKALKKKLPE